MSDHRITLVLALLCPISFSSLAAAPRNPGHGTLAGWNVVLVTLDATDPHRIGAYGGPRKTMPFLDELAQSAAIFEDAYCTTGSTGPSHATILSGLPPQDHGVDYNGLAVRPGIPWLPEILRQHGYTTIGSSAAPFMSPAEAFNRGFDRFAFSPADRGRNSNADGYHQLISLLGPAGWKGLRSPFFVWLHLKGGHDPLVPIDPKFMRRFSATLSAESKPDELRRGIGVATTPATIRDWYAYYDANLNEADATLQMLYRDLDAAGLLGNTLLIITADHGESFDHGMIGEHWPSPWESTLRIPLVLYARGMLNHSRIQDRLVSTEDFAPSILDLLGIDEHPSGWSADTFFGKEKRTSVVGASAYALAYETTLRSLKKGDAVQVRDRISELKNTGLFYWVFVERSVSGPRYKLLYFEHGNNSTYGSGFELYDLAGDGSERRNLIDEGAKRRRQITHMLTRARSEDGFFAASPGIAGERTSRRASASQPTIGLSAETIQMLRSLGYVQ